MFCFKWRTVLTLWTSPRKTVHFWMAGTSTFTHSWSFGPSTQDQKPIPMFIEQSAALNWPYQHSTLSKSSWHFDHTMALYKIFQKFSNSQARSLPPVETRYLSDSSISKTPPKGQVLSSRYVINWAFGRSLYGFMSFQAQN